MFILDLLISFIITYGIGLFPPLIIRYGLKRNPMEKRAATVTAVIFGLINIVIFTAMKGEAASPLPIFIIGSISIAILTAEKSLKNASQVSATEVKNKPDCLLKIYKITGNVSILLSIIGFISGMVVGYAPEDLVPDLIGALIWNLPRFYFGLKLKKQSTSTIDTAIKISKGMFIYSLVVGIVNLLPVFFGSFENLMVGWIYYILIYLYYLSYKKSREFKQTTGSKSTEESTIYFSHKPVKSINNTTIVLLTLSFIGVLTVIILGKNILSVPKSTKTTSIANNNVCTFEISELKESKEGGDPIKIAQMKNDYENNGSDGNTFGKYFLGALERDIWEQENYRWFHYDGLIRNNSDREQKLININAKLRTVDNIFLKESWSQRFNQSLAPGEAIPFKVTIKVDSEDLVRKYVDNSEYKLKTDFYPWFETCNY